VNYRTIVNNSRFAEIHHHLPTLFYEFEVLNLKLSSDFWDCAEHIQKRVKITLTVINIRWIEKRYKANWPRHFASLIEAALLRALLEPHRHLCKWNQSFSKSAAARKMVKKTMISISIHEINQKYNSHYFCITHHFMFVRVILRRARKQMWVSSKEPAKFPHPQGYWHLRTHWQLSTDRTNPNESPRPCPCLSKVLIHSQNRMGENVGANPNSSAEC